MIPIEDILKNSRETTHASIGALLYGMRDTIEQILAIRTREFGQLLDDEEAELMSIKLSLDLLLSDIRESRKFKVKHGC
jgi:hypothetical protein